MSVRWYAVAGGYPGDGVTDSASRDPDDEIWTVSTDPTRAGWNTDGGCPGYGLTKEAAEFLAKAANAAVDRGEISPEWHPT